MNSGRATWCIHGASYGKAAKTLKKECVELRDLVLEYVHMLETATSLGMSEEKIGPELAYALAELEQ